MDVLDGTRRKGGAGGMSGGGGWGWGDVVVQVVLIMQKR